MSKQILKLVADALINEANKQGKLLADIYGTREKFQNAVISSAVIMVKDVIGCELSVAYDIVCGDGAYKALAQSIWERCQVA